VLTEPQKPSNHENFNQKLDELNKQIDDAYKDTQKLVEKRDKLNERFKQLREETRQLKAERDDINEKVHALKTERDETRVTIHPVIDEIKSAREKIAELKKKTPKRSKKDLQQEIDDIEWKIQTTSLDLKEEKQLIETVKQLETQLSTYKKIDRQFKKINELQHGLEAVGETGDKLHTELSGLAQKSQELHQQMLAKIDEARKIKEEADTTHNNYLLTREKIRQLEEQRQRIESEKRRIREIERRAYETQRQQDAEAQKTNEKELRAKLETQAREKLERGEKLSWDEFQLLAAEVEPETQD
jgi:uncharacterized coiled-coil DUF342 family protein